MLEKTRVELKVSPREVLGKKVRRLRREGIIPANIYSRGQESVAIQVPREDLVHVLRTAGRNEIIYLRWGGEEPRPTFARDIQRNPTTDAILHVDFYQISLKEKVRMDVPVTLVGSAPAEVTHGGTLLHSLDHITVEGLPMDIPSVIEVDVSGLEEIDAAIHVTDLQVSGEVTVLTDPEMVVAKVAAPQVEKAVEEEVLEEEAEAAEEEAAAEEKAAEEAPGEGGEEEEG